VALVTGVVLILSAFASPEEHMEDQREERKDQSVYEPVVVLELFTSQGCSSCPSADRVLSDLGQEAMRNGQKIFPLSFHVDYWNRIGWIDPFSAPEFSKRQRTYSQKLYDTHVYTPQLFVNGQEAMVGSAKDKITVAIQKMLKRSSQINIEARNLIIQQGRARIDYLLQGENVESQILNAALVESNLATSVRRGENRGRTLKNDYVVRSMKSIKHPALGGQINLPISEDVSLPKTHLVLYTQNAIDWTVTGAMMVNINYNKL